MSIISIILVILSALECFYIMYLETVITTSEKTSLTFGVERDELGRETVTSLLKNQGVYNGFIGLILLYAVTFANAKVEISAIMLTYIVAMALYGGYTVDKKIVIKQGLLPFIALISLLF